MATVQTVDQPAGPLCIFCGFAQVDLARSLNADAREAMRRVRWLNGGVCEVQSRLVIGPVSVWSMAMGRSGPALCNKAQVLKWSHECFPTHLT